MKHSQLATVSSCIEDGKRLLFDPEKPYFAAWLKLHDIDEDRRYRDMLFSFRRDGHMIDKSSTVFEGNPSLCLYYASLSGFYDLTKHLVARYPQYVDARAGRNQSPFLAAVGNRHFQVAELLHQFGAVLHVIGFHEVTLLHAASEGGWVDIAQWLLKY